MKCDFDYCIYNRNFECAIRNIQINSLGMCDDCIMVSISKEDLEILKEEQCECIGNGYEFEPDD